MPENTCAALVRALLNWFAVHRRPLPWRESRDPYRVWISEVMLQQTRIEAAVPYYRRFLERLPDVRTLAACPEDELLKLWEGLGYYNRARNLQKAAQMIVRDYGGSFPREYEAVRALPGIGDYTAGAICSIAFDLPTPAVDGNVLRVLSRVLNDHRDVGLPAVKKDFTERLSKIYPAGECGAFTQALMELGETVCLPGKAPLCEKCPVREGCRGYAKGTFSELPVRAPKKPRRKQTRTVLLLECGGAYALLRRPNKGLLAGLWEFPNLEGKYTEAALRAWLAERGFTPVRIRAGEGAVHIFSHIEWHMISFHVSLAARAAEFCWAAPEEIQKAYSLPSAYSVFFKEILSRGQGE